MVGMDQIYRRWEELATDPLWPNSQGSASLYDTMKKTIELTLSKDFVQLAKKPA